MSFQILAFLQQIIFLLAEAFSACALLTSKTYRSAWRDSFGRKIWSLWFILLAFDFCWFGLVAYKMGYRIWFSDIPQPTYLLLARLLLLTWPAIIFWHTYMYEQLFNARESIQKRYQFFGIIALGLTGYLAYCFFIRAPLSSDPWLTIDFFGAILQHIFNMVIKGVALVVGIKKVLTDNQMPLIVKKQAKLVYSWIFIPVILAQPLWILQRAGVFQNNIFSEMLPFLATLFLAVAPYYVFKSLLHLRLFNVYPTVHVDERPDLIMQLNEVMHQIRAATTLQELRAYTKTYFEKAFGFASTEVTLYIRPTHHKRNNVAAKAAETLAGVEQALEVNENGPMFEKIRKKRIVLHADVEYDERHRFDDEAKEIRKFLETNNAEAFIPVYGAKELVGYIVIERNARKPAHLINDGEVEWMLLYVDHISYVIDRMQQFDTTTIEKEALEYKRQNYQLLHDLQLSFESAHSLMKTQASQAVTLLYRKQNRIHLANEQGAQLLGLPQGTTIVKGSYEAPVKQLMDDFKAYKHEKTISLKDPKGRVLQFSVMEDVRGNPIVAASLPSISETFKIPVFADAQEVADSRYTLFLQTTEAGRAIEKSIPAPSGPLFTFKIQLLQAIVSRKPIFLQGAEADVKHLIQLAQRITARPEFREVVPQQPETGREFSSQIFGMPAVIFGQSHEGALVQMSSKGVLFLDHIERLSAESQRLLARFFMTGTYTSFFSEQSTSSDALVICSSVLDLKKLAQENLFSKELSEKLLENHLTIPSLLSLTHEELLNLVIDIGTQYLSENAAQQQEGERAITVQVAEELLPGHLPQSIVELQHLIQKKVAQKYPKQVHVAPKLDRGEASALVEQVRRQGRSALKNKPLFSALVAEVGSYTEIAKILGVDYTTIRRRCRDYQIGTYAPGIRRKAGRPKTERVEPALEPSAIG